MPPAARQRLDKWLWCARVVRTRDMAAVLVEAGQVRINRYKVLKPGHDVAVGDVLTIAAHQRVRVLRIVQLADRRGPATVAAGLYEDAAMPAADDPPAKK